jgi:site-specific DNA-methyltransferase (cytosine-N4-specific)
MKNTLYQTNLGKYLIGDSQKLIKNGSLDEYKDKVQLILFSPPFPLNAKKKYGNKLDEEYKK